MRNRSTKKECSNNTNKLSPQEPPKISRLYHTGSNNTNKLSPQELLTKSFRSLIRSNNTNKLSPQEQDNTPTKRMEVQIIQINLVLKNHMRDKK